MSERELEKLISSYIPVPVCIINRQGKVVEASSRIGEVFLYDGIKDGDIFALTGVKTAELYDAAERNIHPLLKRNAGDRKPDIGKLSWSIKKLGDIK